MDDVSKALIAFVEGIPGVHRARRSDLWPLLSSPLRSGKTETKTFAEDCSRSFC